MAHENARQVYQAVSRRVRFGTSEVLFSPLLYQASATVTWFLPSRLAW